MQADVSPSPKQLRGSVVRERGRTLGRKRYRRLLAGSIVLLATGAMFSAAGVIDLQREILLSANGVPALGRGADLRGTKMDIRRSTDRSRTAAIRNITQSNPHRTRMVHARVARRHNTASHMHRAIVAKRHVRSRYLNRPLARADAFADRRSACAAARADLSTEK